MNTNILITLSEGDKRFFTALLIVLVLIIVLIGFLGSLLVKIMQWQGRRMDTLIHDVVVTKVITDKKHLVQYGRKKNWALFFKQAAAPAIIALVGALVLLIRNSIYNDFSYNAFNMDDGFGSLFFGFGFTGEYTGTAEDLIRFRMIEVIHYPTWVNEAWGGYIAGPCFIVAAIWYYVAVSCLIARTTKLFRRSREIFEKSLDGYNQVEADKAKNNNNNGNNS